MILGAVMIGLLVFASLGYSLMSAEGDNKRSVSELGFDFFRDGGLWKVDISGEIFGFQYLPSEVDDVDVNLSVELGMYSGEVLYFVNPNEGASEVLNNIERYVLRYQESCLRQDSGIRDLELGTGEDNDLGNLTNCVGDLPVKDCDSNLIIFVPQSDMTLLGLDGNETRVYGNESCVYLVGDSVRAADAFLYEVLDIR